MLHSYRGVTASLKFWTEQLGDICAKICELKTMG